jgi:GAF domain-containing protein
LKNPTADREAYVRKVQDGMHRYTQEIMAELEKHKRLLAGLEAEKRSLEEKAESVADLGLANTALRALADSLHGDIRRLQEEVTSLRAVAELHQREHHHLEAQLDRVRKETERDSARYAEIEQQNSNLANLYVASYRLHGTVQRPEVLTVIQEIVANLIGSEEMAVYELSAGESTASLVGSFGIDPDRHLTVRVGVGVIGRAVLSGDTYVSEGGPAGEGLPQEADLSACIPLKLDGRVTGAIALFRLLPQKAAFAAVDRELFDLLATHAATALYCSGLPLPLPADIAALA